jgi:azurin
MKILIQKLIKRGGSPIFFLFLLSNILNNLFAQETKVFNAEEEQYYKISTINVPKDIVLEVGGIAMLPDGRVAAATRRGEVWIIDVKDMNNPSFKLFAKGLHEPLGLKFKNNAFYLAQRGELTKLVDEDGDGKADLYESVASWPISGNYHEYSFGPAIKDDGTMFITENVGFLSNEWWRGYSLVPWRGWTQRITPDGKITPFATGMRSPAGIGFNAEGDLFYADNQGDWMGSGFVTHLEEGDFVGHPGGLVWASRPESPVRLSDRDIYARVDPRFAKPGEKPVKPENDPADAGKPFFEVAKDFPAIKVPSVWLPHTILGISTSDILTYKGQGNFGPFEGQMFIGDQGQSKISRVFLEKVKGKYQGAAFPFKEGFSSGVLRLDWASNGMIVGMTNRGWGSTGNEPYGLQKLEWTGKVPFEIKAVRAQPDGFELEFTMPVDKATASLPASYEVTGFIYKYHPVYGSPVINDESCPVKAVVVSDDGLKARLVVDNLREKYIHEIKVNGLNSTDKLALLHPVAYYTLNNIPEGEKLQIGHAGHNMSAPKDSKTTTKKTAAPSSKRVTKAPANWGKADQKVVIGTKPGLKFDLEKVEVKAGSKIEWTFKNTDDMPHNCVIVLPGTAIEVGNLAINMGLKGTELSHIPNTDKVLYHTNLMGPGSSETIYFTAPTTPGEYTIVCTVPGHAYVMQSTLKVVK